MTVLAILGAFALGAGVGLVIGVHLLARDLAAMEREVAMARALAYEMPAGLSVRRGIYDVEAESL